MLTRLSSVPLLILALLNVEVARADLQHHGVITASTGGASTCIQAFTHILTDSCGNVLPLISTQLPLNAFLGQNVTVSGPDVGMNCVLIDVQTAETTPQAGCVELTGSIEPLHEPSPCTEPVTHVLLDGSCSPSVFLTESSLLTLLGPGLSLEDLEGQRVVLEALDFSEPGCPRFEAVWTLSALDCPCQLEVGGLQVHDGLETWLEWNPLPAGCPVSYDVARGFVLDLSEQGGQVDLSYIQCLVADTLESSTFAGPRDTASLLFGDVFFYLVRAEMPPESSYGYSSSGLPRVPFPVDCP